MKKKPIKDVMKQYKNKRPYGANVPIAKEESVVLLQGAKEVHQHNDLPYIVLLLTEEPSESQGPVDTMDLKKTALCLWCGGSSCFTSDTGETDNDGFQLFKQFHRTCPVPKDPVGYFNAEVNGDG